MSTQTKIEPGDIEAKIRELTTDVNEQVETARNKLVTAGIVAAVIALILVFVLGRRAGKKGTTIVEVRRF